MGDNLAPPNIYQIMKKKYSNSRCESNKVDINILGYPTYPEQENIYTNNQEVKGDKFENSAEIKKPIEMRNKNYKNGLKDDFSGSNLEIRGYKMDDAHKKNNKEKNDFYSFGGDDHSDIDDSQGDSTMGYYRFFGF